ncbi:MAG: tRNA pseudouridine(38-40) synthase TruA [Bacilli bacterium]|jgi:tRNA pseudouridine38-40 synthase|nr:tRNA pseudouridine(38-40) synthase TruA [Bacilli bacterium]
MRYKCTVAYDGSAYHGFQIQENNLSTIQAQIERVLKIITKEDTRIYPAGRTDTGVHAYGQVFHFDTVIDMKEWNMKNAINSRLPRDIAIQKVEKVADSFHSRYDAKSKIYHYLIDLGPYDPLKQQYRYYYNHHLDIMLMREAASYLIGEHDFKSFTKNHQITNTVRNLFQLDILKEQNLITFRFHGDGFLHNMVRIIVGMLIEVGRKKIKPEEMEHILSALNRTKAPKIAPPNGLYLSEIRY